MNYRNQQGFTMVELAIVVLVMGLLIGGLMMPLAVQRENARVRDGHEQLETARLAIEGYALVNGHLPCPATPASNGTAATAAGGCVAQHGFVPATTLDLNGNRNDDNLLLDPWGSPLRYSVTTSDADGNGSWDFVTPGEMRSVTMPVLSPELVVCSTAAGSTPTACGSANVTLADRAPAVMYSIGKDWASFSSADQVENTGATLGGGPSATNYRVASDDVFVRAGRSDLAGSEFDDLVIWIPENSLYARLVQSGQLP
ncbi:MAG: type II secretion system protein [Pseudomonadota bacterium]